MSRGDSCGQACAGWILHFLNVVDFIFGITCLLGGVLVLFRWKLASLV